MEGKHGNSSSCSRGEQVEVAPFVAKTYEMVSEPMTDALIRWGRGNNSFLVMDPALFSHLLLPSHFKHSNFSSFVRQLNTYGFRKVDPDKWEFAHESFLRGQTHLLPLIVRRRRRDGGGSAGKREGTAEEEGEDLEEEVEEEEMLLQEVGRLRREQRVIDEELQGMSKRLQATERRPRQMMSFLTRVAEDPDFLPRLITSKKEQQKQRLAGDKKRRLLAPPPPSPPLRLAMSEAVQSLETGALHALEHRAGLLTISREKPLPSAAGASCYYDGVAVLPAVRPTGVDPGGTQRFFPPEFGAPETSSPATDASYPFSLLGQGFF